MDRPRPVFTAQLFPSLLAGLLDLLAELSPGEWERAIPRKSWSVREVAIHLLGGDIGVLSRERDRFPAATAIARSKEELVKALEVFNDTWVSAGRRISPVLLCNLLQFTGEQVTSYVTSLDPYALGEVEGKTFSNRGADNLVLDVRDLLGGLRGTVAVADVGQQRGCVNGWPCAI